MFAPWFSLKNREAKSKNLPKMAFFVLNSRIFIYSLSYLILYLVVFKASCHNLWGNSWLETIQAILHPLGENLKFDQDSSKLVILNTRRLETDFSPFQLTFLTTLSISGKRESNIPANFFQAGFGLRLSSDFKGA
jgi:hypothetical protein